MTDQTKHLSIRKDHIVSLSVAGIYQLRYLSKYVSAFFKIVCNVMNIVFIYHDTNMTNSDIGLE